MFKKAVPIFAAGKENELNTHIVAISSVPSLENVRILISAASFYKLFVNNVFVAFGPCRAAKGYARVDEISLGKYHRNGENTIRIEVAGYACSSFSTVRSESFVCAEVLCGKEVLLYTGRDFECYLSANYLQKTERYSGQRHFSEIYDAREKEPFSSAYRIEATTVASPKWLDRRAPYPRYREVSADNAVTVGSFCFDETLEYTNNKYSFVIDEKWGRYREEEVLYKPFRWIQRQKQIPKKHSQPLPLTLKENEYAIFDLSGIESGFIKFSGEVMAEADVVIGFTELCEPDNFKFTNINCQNVLEYFLPTGDNETVSFEPYTVRFAILFVKKGEVSIKKFGVTTLECDMTGIKAPDFLDDESRIIYDAAVNSFAHNAADIYTDCPSRERAGWLCDSYFMGIVEDFFFGKSDVESAYLENYRLYEGDGRLPMGALPMCYPADLTNEDKFIPQWNMWYVIEVRDYLLKRGHIDEKEDFRKSVTGVIEFLQEYENEYGLLEKLPSWNFVEWSRANDWTKDVNYPTNFLYAEVLRAAYDLYGDEAHREKALRIIEKTTELSFNGEVFIDNAVRNENGALQNTENFSEAGQYYAMLFGDVSLKDAKYSLLSEYTKNGFSEFASHPNFVPVNAFIGRYLRMLLLIRTREYVSLLKDVKGFCLDMSKATGTLWEYKDGKGSRDHGFASFAAVALACAFKKENLIK
ncbi:MAG: hypothetical protein IKU61_04595 [Clostridia bacterium]|nr:hypothetical protein [Clostridia bacterium]